MYLVLGILYESFIHPLTSSPANRRRRWARWRCSGYSIASWIFTRSSARAGRAEARGAGAERGDLPRRADSLSADHDDLVCGPDGDAADRHRHGRRSRRAPLSGPGSGRGPGGFSVADAVHHYVAQARSTEVSACGAYGKARIALDRALGTVLEKHGISIEEAYHGRAGAAASGPVAIRFCSRQPWGTGPP